MSYPLTDKQILENLEFFTFEGPILGSRHGTLPTEKIAKQVKRGEELVKDLIRYHPQAGFELKLEIRNAANPQEACLQATKFGDQWSPEAKQLFSQIQFIPSPSGMKFLIPRKLDPNVHHIKGEWVLHYAKLEGGPNPYDPQKSGKISDMNDLSTRKVVLTWTHKDFDEYVYTCWIWG